MQFGCVQLLIQDIVDLIKRILPRTTNNSESDDIEMGRVEIESEG
jgi:hypothetical protein